MPLEEKWSGKSGECESLVKEPNCKVPQRVGEDNRYHELRTV